MFYINPQKNENFHQYYVVKNVFTLEECESIVRLGKMHQPSIGSTGEQGIISDIRKAKVAFLNHLPETAWLFDRLAQLAWEVNNANWKLNLTGFYEGFQFTNYGVGGNYKWHQDSGNGVFSNRKLSLVVQLTEPEKYAGGNLEFICDPMAEPVRDVGSVILFPSFNVHRVTPVESGVRNSLVAWIGGEVYR